VIKAIIFDCFGVLVGKGFEYTYRLAGGDPVKDKLFINDQLAQTNMGLISDDQFSSAMANQLGVDVTEWYESIKHAEMPDKELLEYIKLLHTDYKTAILSNSNRGVVNGMLGKQWLDDCFDEIIASADVGLVKPDHQLYELTARRLGVLPGQSIFIDDRQSFVDAAQETGMFGIRYTNFESLKSNIDKLIS
jgi:putative hydrolase of the HAD superfamily